MTIEPGSEWLHLETLTAVTVVRQCSESGAVLMYGPIGPAFQVTIGEFRDYRPNVLLTADNIAEFGGPDWQLSIVDQLHWSPIVQEGGGPWWSGGAEIHTTHPDGHGMHTIAVRHPATLRDLLELLKRLGVPFTLPVSN